MNLLLDTNIIINIVRSKDYIKVRKFINPTNALLYASIVSEAEVKAFAVRKRWGVNRMEHLNLFLDTLNIVDVTKPFITTYIEIDTYSQRLNPSFTSYPFDTPRNMGKNDLWIASLAAFLGLRPVTTDADFDHLHQVFLEVRKIQPAEFVAFF